MHKKVQIIINTLVEVRVLPEMGLLLYLLDRFYGLRPDLHEIRLFPYNPMESSFQGKSPVLQGPTHETACMSINKVNMALS